MFFEKLHTFLIVFSHKTHPFLINFCIISALKSTINMFNKKRAVLTKPVFVFFRYMLLSFICFEKQKLESGEKAKYVLTFYLDPELMKDLSAKNVEDVTLSYTFFSSDYY